MRVEEHGIRTTNLNRVKGFNTSGKQRSVSHSFAAVILQGVPPNVSQRFDLKPNLFYAGGYKHRPLFLQSALTCFEDQQVQCVISQVGGGSDLVRGDSHQQLLVVSPRQQQTAS